jgi:hypothetical protein
MMWISCEETNKNLSSSLIWYLVRIRRTSMLNNLSNTSYVLKPSDASIFRHKLLIHNQLRRLSTANRGVIVGFGIRGCLSSSSTAAGTVVFCNFRIIAQQRLPIHGILTFYEPLFSVRQWAEVTNIPLSSRDFSRWSDVATENIGNYSYPHISQMR